ncbi:hypothetical protein [Benzoatithermus flavus]|uniref:Uncharacterized protein n=1 Tax=Benzoatithermus flavus TaxID=3108223 RepID=A0ABU8XXN5_9PROT
MAMQDPNEEVVVRPYMRGTLALLAAMPADRPVDEASLARAVGGRTPGWARFVEQLLDLRLADEVSLDGRPLLLLPTPAGLVLREQLCRPRKPVAVERTLLERIGLEWLAMLEALAEFGPLRLSEVLAACRHLPGDNREVPLARSRFTGLTRRRRLIEIVPGDELLEPAMRRYRVTDAAWRIVAARRRLHATAYDLEPFARCLAAMRAPADRPAPAGAAAVLRRRQRRRPPVPGQLSLF